MINLFHASSLFRFPRENKNRVFKGMQNETNHGLVDNHGKVQKLLRKALSYINLPDENFLNPTQN